MKLIRVIFIILIIISPTYLFGQSNRPSNCAFLKKALEDTTFATFIDSNTVFVDTTGYFKDCKISVQGKQLIITNRWDSCFTMGDHTKTQFQNLAGKYRNYVIIIIQKQLDNEVFLNFRNPSTNIEVESEVKGKNKRIWVKHSNKYTVIYEDE